MMRPLASRTLAALAVLALAACGREVEGVPVPALPSSQGPAQAPTGRPPSEGTRPEPGGPLPGLEAEELAAFRRGRELFLHAFRPSEGLGPHYNATGCVSCHSAPTPGGSSQLYRNFYLAAVGEQGDQFPLPGLPSVVVPAYGEGLAFSTAVGRRTIPTSLGSFAVTTAQRNAPPLYGVALFEFVSNATILANSDPDDLDGDGISGRFNTDDAGVGRFGYKAQSNNIELFTRAPLKTQLGITTDPFDGSSGVVSLSLRQATQGPNNPTRDDDGVPDPELGRGALGDLLAFQRFLAPVRKKLPFSAAASRGEPLFEALGCAACHLPALPSSRGLLEAYTDLLLHDMGPALADGIHFGTAQASSLSSFATGQEWRTQPLWGVSLHGPFLHDGRAETLHAAIELHGGEAQGARDAYLGLDDSRRADLLAFLEHL